MASALADWSKDLHKTRGTGSGSRIILDFAKLEEHGWSVSSRQVGAKTLFSFISPGDSKFKSAKDVERFLRSEGTLNTFIKADALLEETMAQPKIVVDTAASCDDPDYEPPNKKKPHADDCKTDTTLPEGLFVATTSSITSLVKKFNRFFKCPSKQGQCKGKLVFIKATKKGLGGSMHFLFRCNGCWAEEIDYQSSQLALDSRRQLVSLALCLAFFVSGHGYAGYRKTLGKGLGLGVVSEKPYLEVIDLALPQIKQILEEMCEEAKQQMRDLPDDDLGSWARAVTTCDGCWQIRGHFSQNCTFIVKNYLSGALLYYGHLSMRGADKICNEDLWQGTAKAAEGHLAQVLWAKAKEEGLKVEVNWQDADSSSAKGFRYSFDNEQESKIMLCGGHVGRAHGKKLLELQGKSTFTKGYIDQHKKDFPQIESVKCVCSGTKHNYVSTRNKPSCGCIGNAFIQGAKRNHYCAMVHAGNDPEKYRETMLTLGKYHCRDIHQWEGGSCNFHPLLKCSCKGCEADADGFVEQLKCSGEAYHSANVLKCEFHALGYEIECHARAKEAERVIDPGLGKGHSNLPESTFSVLTKFRAKDINLHQKHYQASTNMGLIQANMTWAFKTRGPEYHWITDLYSRLGLPVLDGIQQICKSDSMERMKKLERKRTDAEKKKRIKHKIGRAEEQELRKKYVKRMQIRHSYGDDDAADGDSCEATALQVTEAAIADGSAPGPTTLEEVPAPVGSAVAIGGKACKWCGSTSHVRKTHKDCPFNPRKQAGN